MSLDQDRRTLTSKEGKLANVEKRIAEKSRRLSAEEKKANDARTAAERTRSASVQKSKLRAYDSAMANATKYRQELSRLQSQSASMSKEIQRLREKIAAAEKREREAAARESRKTSCELDNKLRTIDSSLSTHDRRLRVLESMPSQITVLYLGVSPEGEARLRLDAEAREIREALRMSDHPDSIALSERWAVRQQDLLQALNETNPTIVHFSGHGSDDGCLYIEDQVGDAQAVTKEAMAAVIGAAAEGVRLVVFNACFSDEEADKVLEHVDAVIGMTDSIEDDVAVAFARQLYSSIGFGHDLQLAFKQARAAIALTSPSSSSIPKLRVAEGVDPSMLYFVKA